MRFSIDYLSVRYRAGRTQAPEPALLHGAAAQRALALLLPHANATGASARRIREAVGVIESAATMNGLVYQAATAPKAQKTMTGAQPLTQLPAPIRLALEMVLHSDDERRVMEGQLAELEQRWQEAEQIASIADSLLIHPHAQLRFDALRRLGEE